MFPGLNTTPSASAADTIHLRRAMWLLCARDSAQYLLSNSKSRLSGALKAERHRILTSNYVAVLTGLDPELMHRDIGLYNAIHDTTASELTNCLDRAIGFDPEAFVGEELMQAFFIRFHVIAMRVGAEFAAQRGAAGNQSKGT